LHPSGKNGLPGYLAIRVGNYMRLMSMPEGKSYKAKGRSEERPGEDNVRSGYGNSECHPASVLLTQAEKR
jgi:hypothetical protein